MGDKHRILLVEDEEFIAHPLKVNLELEGYKVQHVDNGKAALKTFRQEKFSLIVLDVMLPEMDGYAVCEAIRLENNKVPILFLTAKGSSSDRVNGLKLGADDYLSKPFNLEEFLLRANNLIKRSVENVNNAVVDTYKIRNYTIHFADMRATEDGGNTLELTKKETALLKLLIERKNEIVSREHILETVWGYDVYPSTRTIDNFIVSFRKYFEENPSSPQYFQSVRGVGYRFVDK
ncbi:MAG: response regulator transcription factor [Bacteroidetes bacterium]|nr:response regulator transcription factor [Bacteroidota bacterium]